MDLECHEELDLTPLRKIIYQEKIIYQDQNIQDQNIVVIKL